MDRRRESVEHPFGSIKQWMGQGAFLTRRLDNVRGEFSLTALAYNMATRDQSRGNSRDDRRGSRLNPYFAGFQGDNQPESGRQAITAVPSRDRHGRRPDCRRREPAPPVPPRSPQTARPRFHRTDYTVCNYCTVCIVCPAVAPLRSSYWIRTRMADPKPGSPTRRGTDVPEGTARVVDPAMPDQLLALVVILSQNIAKIRLFDSTDRARVLFETGLPASRDSLVAPEYASERAFFATLEEKFVEPFLHHSAIGTPSRSRCGSAENPPQPRRPRRRLIRLDRRNARCSGPRLRYAVRSLHRPQ